MLCYRVTRAESYKQTVDASYDVSRYVTSRAGFSFEKSHIDS